MKRSLLILIIFADIFCKVYAQEFEFKLNYGNFGGGMNVFPDENNFELSASLLNIFIEHNKTNIGLEVTPLKYIANAINTQELDQGLYFLNGKLYWNPFDIKNIILGPFVSINYLKLENWSGFNTGGYLFDSGLEFLLKTYIEDWKYPFHIIGTEIGYRNISGRSGFYFNVNLDISILVWFVATILQDEASEVIEANEDYEKQIKGTGPFVPKEPKQPKPPFQNERDIE
jgi:hypothetical protein